MNGHLTQAQVDEDNLMGEEGATRARETTGGMISIVDAD